MQNLGVTSGSSELADISDHANSSHSDRDSDSDDDGNLLFFERCNLITANFHKALMRFIQFVCTHRRSYKTISFEKDQPIA